MCYFCGQGCAADPPSFKECPDKEDASKGQRWDYNHYEFYGYHCEYNYDDRSKCKCKSTN